MLNFVSKLLINNIINRGPNSTVTDTCFARGAPSLCFYGNHIWVQGPHLMTNSHDLRAAQVAPVAVVFLHCRTEQNEPISRSYKSAHTKVSDWGKRIKKREDHFWVFGDCTSSEFDRGRLRST